MPTRTTRWTFDDYTLDVGERRLLRGGESIHLAPKAFDLLRLLIERRPGVVPKIELMAMLWPRTFVVENNLATHIADLRAALRDTAREPRLIRTVHGVGYAFEATAKGDAGADEPGVVPASAWKLIWDRTELRLQAGDNILGRPADGVIGVEAPTVSRRHARIAVAGDRATVEDLGSKNGTWLGAARVTAPVPIIEFDELRIGSVLMIVRRASSIASTLTMASRDRSVTE